MTRIEEARIKSEQKTGLKLQALTPHQPLIVGMVYYCFNLAKKFTVLNVQPHEKNEFYTLVQWEDGKKTSHSRLFQKYDFMVVS